MRPTGQSNPGSRTGRSHPLPPGPEPTSPLATRPSCGLRRYGLSSRARVVDVRTGVSGPGGPVRQGRADIAATGMWRRENGREVPNERHWSAQTSTSARNARADLVRYTPLPAETGPVWAPDRLSVWPVEGGRFGIDAHYHGVTGIERAHVQQITAGEARARCVGQARRRRWSDPHRASRARSHLARTRGVPRPPSLTDRPRRGPTARGWPGSLEPGARGRHARSRCCRSRAGRQR